MATEAQLRQRMRQLEQELAQIRRESAQLESKIRQQTDAQIRKLQQQTQQAFQRKLHETEEAYTRRIREFQEQILRESRETVRELVESSQQLQQQMQQKVVQLEECNAQLTQELKKLRDDAEKQKQTFLSAAQEASREAEAAQKLAEQTPHSFFCPMEFDIIAGHITQLPELIEQGMYQAAVSDANCLALDFKLLRIKVEQAYNEWLMAFDDYCRILSALAAQIEAFEGATVCTAKGTFTMGPKQLNFWSSGAYAPLRAQILEAYELFGSMTREQIPEYLQANAGTNRRASFDRLKQAHQWQDQLAAVINCILSERVQSDQRMWVAEQLSKELTPLNYLEEEMGFRAPSQALRSQSWYVAPEEENPMDTHILVMCLAKHNRTRLLAIPRREHGLCVANDFILLVDFYDAADRNTELQIGQTTASQLQLRIPGIRVQFVSSQDHPEQVVRSRELLGNTAPNPTEQMRHLERKYQ